MGKRANLLLLDADPLADIRNSRAIASVIFNGGLFDREALDERLSALDAFYAPYRSSFSAIGANALERWSGALKACHIRGTRDLVSLSRPYAEMTRFLASSV